MGANHKITTLAISPSLTGLDCEFIRLAQQRYHFKLGCELNGKRRFRGYYGKDWQIVALDLDVGCCTYCLNGKLRVHCVPLFRARNVSQPYREPVKPSLWQKIKVALSGSEESEDEEPEFNDIDDESEIEIDESEEYPEEWGLE